MKMAVSLLLVLSCCLASYAQDSTKVKFLVKGSEVYYVRVDGVLQPVKNIHSVSKGSHEIEIWSPKYQLYKDQLETGKLDSTNYVALLKIDPSYVAYIAQREEYKRDVFLMRTAPVLLASFSTATAPILYLLRRNKHEELIKNEFYVRYNAVSSDVLNNTRNQYNLYSGAFFTAVGGAVGGTALFLLLRKTAKELEAPVFRQQNPFTLEYFQLSMNEFNRSPQVGLTLNF